MHIDDYSFGSIWIDGKEYTADVIVFPEKVSSDWWRIEGHLLQMQDLSEILEYRPDILVIGKGASGVMQVPSKVINELKDKNIEVIAKNTDEACHTFNKLIKDNKKVVGAFHLTC